MCVLVCGVDCLVGKLVLGWFVVMGCGGVVCDVCLVGGMDYV